MRAYKPVLEVYGVELGQGTANWIWRVEEQWGVVAIGRAGILARLCPIFLVAAHHKFPVAVQGMVRSHVKGRSIGVWRARWWLHIGDFFSVVLWRHDQCALVAAMVFRCRRSPPAMVRPLLRGFVGWRGKGSGQKPCFPMGIGYRRQWHGGAVFLGSCREVPFSPLGCGGRCLGCSGGNWCGRTPSQVPVGSRGWFPGESFIDRGVDAGDDNAYGRRVCFLKGISGDPAHFSLCSGRVGSGG